MIVHSLVRLLLAVLLAAIAMQAFAERTTTFYHNDALGSVVAASDESGQLLWRKEYAPFGQQLDSTAGNEKLSYTGKEHDDATGLTFFGARYYDPYLGRFMSIDPAGINPADPFTFNRYGYSNNNPYRFIDPNGRQSADTACDETCEYELTRQSAARGAKMVAEGASDLADIADEEASSPWNWIPFLGAEKKIERAVRRGSSARFISRTSGEILDIHAIRVPGPVNSTLGKVDYLLGNVNSVESKGKGGFFRGVLGFSEKNLEPALKQHLIDNFGTATMQGNKVRATGTMTGANGKTANVLSVWQITAEGSVDFVTAMPK
jgi:RHS repeat-associated protein